MCFGRHFLLILCFLFFQPAIAQDRVTLTFIGDIMGHGAQIEDAAYHERHFPDVNAYQHCFQYVKRSLSKSDFTIGNLEVTLAGAPYAGYPTFSSPASLLDASRDAGIDVFALANNHVLDRGSRGVVRTTRKLESRGIPYMGAYRDSASHDSLNGLVLQKGDFRIGVLNYTYGTNGITARPPIMINYIDTVQIKNDIDSIRKKQVDEVVVMLHWGNEYQLKPSRSQRRLTTFLHENGVRVVIGSHPHVVQPIDWNREKQELCVYSLGNFISNQRESPKDIGLIVHVTLMKNGEKTHVEDVSYQTTYVHRFKESNGYCFTVLPYSFIGKDSIAFYNSKLRSKASSDEKVIRELLGKSKARYLQYDDQFDDSIPCDIKPKVWVP
ncbi:CapA family protein [Halosquirtibacter xylanolyticus]|uniref:CapA family protein n=1 Tax=Halosquirtibacter xylanolyticus TaxID=3374599 RepID=UPI00374842C9|nr:CapA family protein [Prolixibacteraceae bacterium]